MEHQAHGTGEKKGIMDKIKEKLPGGHGDHQQTAGTHGQQGHTGTGAHVSPATGGTYGQQGHTGTGVHGADTGEKKGVMDKIKEKLPGGHGDQQQTAGTYGQQGHTGTKAHTAPATGDTYGKQGHTGTGMHGADTGEKKGVMENIKDTLPGGHGDHQQTGGTYGQQGHVSTGTHGTPAVDDTYGQQGHTGHTGTGMHGADTGEKKGIMENIKEKFPGGHDEHQQAGGTYGQQGHVGTGTHSTPATGGTYGQQGHTGTGMHGAHTGEKKGVMENIKDKLPGGHQHTGGTYEHQEDTEMTGMGMHSTPATGGTYGQQGHTGMTGTGAHGTGEKKDVMENIKEKLPGGHADHQQTTGTYGQQGHVGTGAHGTPATGGTYGQHGHTGVTDTTTHSTDNTGEKKGVIENIKEKLPGGHTDQQQTTDTYGQHGHTGMTGTETHGTTATGGTYGQQGHTGTTGTGTHGTDGIGEKKSPMDKIKEKLPGQH